MYLFKYILRVDLLIGDIGGTRRTRELADKLLSNHDVHITEFHGRRSAWDFLRGKTERAAFDRFIRKFLRSLKNRHILQRADYIQKELESAGYEKHTIGSLQETFGGVQRKSRIGQRYYVRFQDTMVVAVQFGKRPITEGMHMAAAHIDSPAVVSRIKVPKQAFNIAYALCTSYGGIEPKDVFNKQLSMYFHGIVKDKKGKRKRLEFSLGNENGDPCFVIAEGSLHLNESNNPEPCDLEAIIGSKPHPDKTFDPRKRIILAVMRELNKKYDLTEYDLEDGELWFFPAEQAREVGVDKSAISSYGMDNWACAFPLLHGFLSAKQPEYTKVAVFYDNEENCDTGRGSWDTSFFDLLLLPALAYQRKKGTGHHYESLEKSWSLFADVSEPINSYSPSTQDPLNNSYFGSGVAICPSSGDSGRGGYIVNPAFISAMKTIFNENKVCHQTGIMGRYDEKTAGASDTFHSYVWGGGIDIGVPVLGLHRFTSEVCSKIDVWHTAKAIHAFFSVKDHSKYLLRREV